MYVSMLPWLLTGALTLVAGPAASQSIDLSGKYMMEGSMDGPRGAAYKGECDLRQVSSYYEVSCINGNDRYAGKGMARGETFSLYLGEYLLVYGIEAGRRLNGTWVHITSQATGKEVLTPKVR